MTCARAAPAKDVPGANASQLQRGAVADALGWLRLLVDVFQDPRFGMSLADSPVFFRPNRPRRNCWCFRALYGFTWLCWIFEHTIFPSGLVKTSGPLRAVSGQGFLYTGRRSAHWRHAWGFLPGGGSDLLKFASLKVVLFNVKLHKIIPNSCVHGGKKTSAWWKYVSIIWKSVNMLANQGLRKFLLCFLFLEGYLPHTFWTKSIFDSLRRPVGGARFQELL